MHKTKIILILWFFTLMEINSECPELCKCDDSSVFCINLQLPFVPDLSLLNFSPIIIDYSGNNFVMINFEDFNFFYANDVTELYLNHSNIADIAERTFDSLENLQELYLGENDLNNFPVDLFECLDSLVLLDLSGNYFNGDMPLIRSNSLELLSLINCKITNIPTNALQDLPNLKVLILEENKIENLSFEPFQHLPIGSVVLKLSYNLWRCSSENIKNFRQLVEYKFIDSNETHQCLNKNTGEIVAIRDKNGNNKFSQVISNISISRTIKSANFTTELKTDDDDVESMNDTNNNNNNSNKLQELKIMNEICCGFSLEFYNANSIVSVIIILILLTFFIGFISGMIFCKIIYKMLNKKFNKIQQNSDSRIQLLLKT